MKLKKFLQDKVLGNPYYERLTLIIVFSIIISIISKVLLKTGLWDSLESTLDFCIDMYKVFYYTEVLIFMLAQISVLGYKAFTLLVLSLLIITILNNYSKGKKYDEQKHGLTDYQTDIKPK